MKEFFQEIAKQRGILLVIIGVILLIFGAASSVQIGQNSISVNPTYQIIILTVAGLLILLGAVVTIRENALSGETHKRQTTANPDDYLKSLDFLYSQSATHKKELVEATQIDLLGYSLTGFMLTFSDALVQAIQNGARVRMLFMNPNGEAINIMKKISPKGSHVENINYSLRSAVTIAHKSKNSVKGGIELRLIDWIPSCSLIITDPSRDKGRVILGIYAPHYRSPTDKNLHLILTAMNEKDWLDFYVDQFDLLWAEAKPYSLKKEP